MSFVGELEHLPIVDVIQLLHSTRKSGTLCLTCHKGESQLVFDEGYIVGANHVNNSVRIGQILVGMNALKQEELEQALLEQKGAGAGRRPLIATLIESGRLKREDAYKGLEALIEMTIVEVLTWTEGTFSLDVDKVIVSDEYRYFPETLHQDLHLNTQNVLMDALRIYDEKMRDGTLSEETFAAGDAMAAVAAASDESSQGISADVLGLADLDNLERKIPDVFLGLKDYDPAEIHRQKIREGLGGLPAGEQEKLLNFLVEFPPATRSDLTQPAAAAPAVIVFSRDEPIKHTILTVCRHEGFFVFTTDEEINLDPILEQAIGKGHLPVLLLDAPDPDNGGLSSERAVTLVRNKLERYPQLAILQLVSARDYEFTHQVLQAGVTAVLTPPCKEQSESYAADMIKFVETFRSYIRRSLSVQDQEILDEFKESIFALGGLREAPDVAFVLLRFTAAMLERAVTLIVGKEELIAERGIGIKTDKNAGASPPLRFKIPLTKPSLFREVIERGALFYEESDDPLLRRHLFAEIDAPRSSRIVLAPVKSFGRVIALIYGDFGSNAASPIKMDLLDILTRHAGLVLDNALYRKKFEKTSPARQA